MNIRPLYENVPGRDLARGIEQTLINQKGLGNLSNKINSISEVNQKGMHSGTMKAAKAYMGIN